MEQEFIEFSKFRDSDKSLKHWAQFKDPVSHMCLAGVGVHHGLLHKRWQV